MKWKATPPAPQCLGRSPHGERGLKFPRRPTPWSSGKSLPSRGAWIEIPTMSRSFPGMMSLPSRGAWIEIRHTIPRQFRSKSLPSRGAWIEIKPCAEFWNPQGGRSPHGERGLKYPGLAPRSPGCQSLPSRGAWIEIFTPVAASPDTIVAPLTGSVD